MALALDDARPTWLRGPCAVLLAASVVVTSALTFVNYIPDDISNALGALAIPLTRSGDLVPSVLCAFGLANPVAGVVLWLGVAVSVAWLLWSLRPQMSIAACAATLVTAGAFSAFQALTFRDSPSDRAGLMLLERVWLATPGRTFTLLTPEPEPLRIQPH